MAPVTERGLRRWTVTPRSQTRGRPAIGESRAVATCSAGSACGVVA
ncbi:hypothetical protein ERO13_D03G021650v2 [Gossypium hirsutum]|nr:hypothetical protein ERO13_D03G021650v2 [Gossypium hirsutum]